MIELDGLGQHRGKAMSPRRSSVKSRGVRLTFCGTCLGNSATPFVGKMQIVPVTPPAQGPDWTAFWEDPTLQEGGWKVCGFIGLPSMCVRRVEGTLDIKGCIAAFTSDYVRIFPSEKDVILHICVNESAHVHYT